MGERLNPGDFYKERNDWEAPEATGTEPVKLFDGPFRYRGFHDREPTAVCRVRLFHRGNETPVMVLSEDLANPSTSITNAMEFLAPEAIRHFCPERFEWSEVVVLLEHYPEERDRRGRLGRRASWDRVSFDSWAPRRVRFGGQERLSLGEPGWQPMPLAEVEELIGTDEAKD